MAGLGLTDQLRRCSPSNGDDAMHRDARIAIAQNLVRIYRHVLEQPVPPLLLDLLNRLQAQEAGHSK